MSPKCPNCNKDLNAKSGQAPFKRDNHYVPRSYLKRWAANDKRVWTYRILVSNSNVPKWKAYSIKGIAYHSYLYTRIVKDEKIDEIERWLDSEYENPAEPVIEKVLAQKKMSPKDWSILIKYMASQDVRTPAYLSKSLKIQENSTDEIMRSTLEKTVSELKVAKEEGRAIKPKRVPNSEYIPMHVSIEDDSKTGRATIKAKTVTGRSIWLFSIKYLLENSKSMSALLGHKWTILKSPEGIRWCTSDNPVIKLNYYSPNNYNFKGGWGSKGTELLFPLSPNFLLYTKIGERPPQKGTVLSVEMANIFQKIILEHAYRFIYSTEKNLIVESIRPRTESRSIFNDEKHQWQEWHSKNVQIEKELYE